jgi:hypothetical protein
MLHHIENADNTSADRAPAAATASRPPGAPHPEFLLSTFRISAFLFAPSPARAQRGRQNTTKHDKMRQNTTSGSPGRRLNPIILPTIICQPRPSLIHPSEFSLQPCLPTSPVIRISAPFLHRFCTMKSNSTLYRATPGRNPLNSQLIERERVAPERGFEKENFGKEKVKFWMLHQPLTSMTTEIGQKKVKKR